MINKNLFDKKINFFPGILAKNTIILGKITKNLEKLEMMICGTKPRKASSKTIYSSYKSKRLPKPKFDYVL